MSDSFSQADCYFQTSDNSDGIRLVADKLAKQFGDSCRLLREQDGWIALHRRVFLQISEIFNRCLLKSIVIVLPFWAGRFVSVMKLFQLFAIKSALSRLR
jgi:hypothetical protein